MYGIDSLQCPRGVGGPRRIAALTNADTITAIIESIGLPATHRDDETTLGFEQWAEFTGPGTSRLGSAWWRAAALTTGIGCRRRQSIRPPHHDDHEPPRRSGEHMPCDASRPASPEKNGQANSPALRLWAESARKQCNGLTPLESA